MFHTRQISYRKYRYLIFSSRYSFKAIALLNFSSFEPYNKVIGPSFILSRIVLTDSLFFSSSLKYRALKSFHLFSSCENHFLSELLGAMSFCHKSTFTLALLNPRGHSLSTSTLKVLFPLGLLYILSTFITNRWIYLKITLSILHKKFVKQIIKICKLNNKNLLISWKNNCFASLKSY